MYSIGYKVMYDHTTSHNINNSENARYFNTVIQDTLT